MIADENGVETAPFRECREVQQFIRTELFG
jgi:hypothetical protein